MDTFDISGNVDFEGSEPVKEHVIAQSDNPILEPGPQGIGAAKPPVLHTLPPLKKKNKKNKKTLFFEKFQNFPKMFFEVVAF